MSVNSTALTIFSPDLKSAQPLACRLFEAAFNQGKVANAYLLVGRAAEDKLALAREIAAHLNCQGASRTGGSCLVSGDPDVCLNCQWIAKGEHPQAWLALTGEGKSQKIPVEKVRALTDELSKTSTFVRVMVVPEANEGTFHRPAANALLKSIEEPPANCVFFFFADSTDDVLATIVSRCQIVPVNKGMELGYWKASEKEGIDADVVKRLDAARANFDNSARRVFAAPNAQPYLRGVNDSLELSRQLQDLCKELMEFVDEYDAAERVLDLFVACEIEVLKENAYNDSVTALYISRVCDLAEKAKRQIGSYVKQGNAIESFSLALNELRHAHSGEISCAKR